MRRLETHVDPSSPTYRAYREHNLEQAADLRAKLHAARHERPERALARLAEQEKLSVRAPAGATARSAARRSWS